MQVNNKMLFEECERYRKEAGRILSELKILKILRKYGRVQIVGSYVLNLMTSGDIDIYVIGNSFTKKNALEAFNKVVNSTKFNIYYLGDWQRFRRQGFPKGYYVGLKTRKRGETWKIDIWFVSQRELKKFEALKSSIDSLNQEKKIIILKLKKFLHQYYKDLSSYWAYKAAIENKVVSIDQFKKFLKRESCRLY